MVFSDLKKDYKAPQAKVIEVNVQGMLCQSVGSYKDPFGGEEPETI